VAWSRTPTIWRQPLRRPGFRSLGRSRRETTGEAIRWCARYAIPLILPDGQGRAILFQESALETADAGRGLDGRHAGRIRDIAPSLIRAQVLTDPVRVARAIVGAKLAASAAHAEAIDQSKWSLSLERTQSVPEIVTIEARIAASYWRAFRHLGLRERKGGNLPRSWLRFANRQKGARFLGARHASHPINAMLNYAYVVEAGRLARPLTAIGLALPKDDG
jgi:CRISPR/Cas system-associated endonuclease Cas1